MPWMSEHLLIGVSSVIVLGIAAQWLAWRLHLPSILLLLVFGFVAGPLSGLLDPDVLMGELLFPVVSISVALILFEGGLSLKMAELTEIHHTVRNLISVGAGVTWMIAAAAAYLILDFDGSLALLFGAVLVVTGPTVVIPLLRHIRPLPRVGSVARWEGIMIDPVGATLAVLVFEAILAGGTQAATGEALFGFLQTLLVGSALGITGSALLVILLWYYLIPDFLQNPVTLMIVVTAFAASNLLQSESGLLTVTLMGLILANQRWVGVKHIVEFKENLRVLLISALFILLAARLQIQDLEIIDARSLLFVAILILVARPASVWIATMGSRLNRAERLFLAWLAPRGIVAAAVASIFSLRLMEAGYPNAERLVALTFLIIIVTVTLYGLTSPPLARWLGLAQRHPQGFLIMGAHSWARALGGALQSAGFRTVLVDTNRENTRLARMSGLSIYHGSILDEYALDEIDLDGIGRLLALTANDEANALACLRCSELFGRAEVYQLAPQTASERKEEGSAHHLRGRLLFHRDANYRDLSRRFAEGTEVKITRLSEAFDFDDLKSRYPKGFLPLFLIPEAEPIRVFVTDRTLAPRPGGRVVFLAVGPTGDNSHQ